MLKQKYGTVQKWKWNDEQTINGVDTINLSQDTWLIPSRMPERGSFGLRFFSQPRANSQRRQMKSCLSAICMKLQSQIDKQRRDGEREGEGANSETRRDYLLKTLRYCVD